MHHDDSNRSKHYKLAGSGQQVSPVSQYCPSGFQPEFIRGTEYINHPYYYTVGYENSWCHFVH